jgi:hypothetical protein
MSLFSDTVDAVYTLTGRADLVAETALAVRQATQSAHRSDYYPRDMTEVAIPLTAAAVFQLDIPTFFPRWRAFSYMRPYDTLIGTPASYLIEFIKPEAIFDEYLTEKLNVAYAAGTNLNVRMAAAVNGFIVGYYLNPVLSPDGAYASWVAEDHPSIIVLDAAIKIFGMIGYEEAAGRLRRLLYDPGPEGAPSEFNRFRGAALEEHGR